MKKFLLSFLIQWLIIYSAYSQTFEKTYMRGEAVSAALCQDGGYLVALMDSSKVGKYIKLDAMGNMEWVKSLDSMSIEGIAETSVGKLAIAASFNNYWEDGEWFGDCAFFILTEADGKFIKSAYRCENEWARWSMDVLAVETGNILFFVGNDGIQHLNALELFIADSNLNIGGRVNLGHPWNHEFKKGHNGKFISVASGSSVDDYIKVTEFLENGTMLVEGFG